MPLTHLELLPGERAEVVVAMRPGERVILRSSPLASADDRFAGTNDSLDILELRAADRLDPSPRLPAELAPAPDLAERPDIATTCEFTLNGTNINDQDMDMDRIDVAAELGSTERWHGITSGGSGAQLPHPRCPVPGRASTGPAAGHSSGAGRTPSSCPPGRRSTLVHFADYADPNMPYMFHCQSCCTRTKG